MRLADGLLFLADFVFDAGCRGLYLSLCDPASQPGRDHPRQEHLGPAGQPLPGQHCPSTDPREEVVSMEISSEKLWLV